MNLAQLAQELRLTLGTIGPHRAMIHEVSTLHQRLDTLVHCAHAMSNQNYIPHQPAPLPTAIPENTHVPW